MKRPVTAYDFWTGYNPKTNLWGSYFSIYDDEYESDEPIGTEGSGATAEEALAEAMRFAADYDDGRCTHGRDPRWCRLCKQENGDKDGAE